MRSFSRSVFLALLMVGVFPIASAVAQLGDPIRLYGYFQGLYRYSAETALTINSYSEDNLDSFSLQQLNILMAKNLDASFSAFVNLELTNSFSTIDDWGDIRLEEAWLQYKVSPMLRIKLGLQIPEFNNLNTIKNRTPLLPYIIRPIVYETTFNAFTAFEQYVPQHNFIQVTGSRSLHQTRFDYTVHIGNWDEFVTTETDNSAPSSTDLALGSALGGRVGIRHKSVKVGASATYDYINERDALLGKVQRLRLGADASFTLRRVYFESEFISVAYSLSDAQHLQLIEATRVNPLLGLSLDKIFYYVSLGYYVTDMLYIYGIFNRVVDDFNIAVAEGLEAGGVGLALRPLESVSLKLQYLQTRMDAPPAVEYQGKFLFAAVSVLF